jgi:hypothetical protein
MSMRRYRTGLLSPHDWAPDAPAVHVKGCFDDGPELTAMTVGT